MKTASFHSLVLSLSLLFTWTGCQKDTRDFPTRGNLVVISSEDIFPVMDAEVKEFQSMYKEAHIVHLQSTPRDAIAQLLNDSVKVITSSRQFNDEEKAVIAKYKLQVDTFRVAYEAALVIVNEKNSHTRIKVEELKDILLGKSKMWRDVGEKKVSGRINVALGMANSGMFEYVKKRITNMQPFADVVHPCSTTTDVISYVATHENAIGFVDQSWVSSAPANTRILDIGDPGFARDSTSTILEYFPPLQAHVYRGYYPLTRTLYLFSRNAGNGVGIGLTAFMTGVEGQKLFKENGLVPATMPVRLVQPEDQ